MVLSVKYPYTVPKPSVIPSQEFICTRPQTELGWKWWLTRSVEWIIENRSQNRGLFVPITLIGNNTLDILIINLTEMWNETIFKCKIL